MAQFLNTFAAVPERGTILFPRIENDSVHPVELTEKTAPQLRAVAHSCLYEAVHRFGRSQSLPFSFPLTNHDWSLTDCLTTKDEAFVKFTSQTGRYLELYSLNDILDVSVGAESKSVDFRITASLSSHPASTRTDYTFLFCGKGLADLRTLLAAGERPLYEIALALASRIYWSGQYKQGSVRPVVLRPIQPTNSPSLNPRVSFILTAPDAGPFQLTAEAKDSLDSVSHFRLFAGNVANPLFSIEGTPSESLDIYLCNLRGGLMPLQPLLKTGLWDRAEQILAATVSSS